MKYWLIVGLMLLAACTTPLKIEWQTAKHVNPDEQNQALPVQVVIYQLRDDTAFLQATFEQLWQNDQATLGASLINRREMNIAPDSRNNMVIDRQKETLYIGAIAIFRNPAGARWRSVKKIGKGMPFTHKQLHLLLKNNTIYLR